MLAVHLHVDFVHMCDTELPDCIRIQTPPRKIQGDVLIHPPGLPQPTCPPRSVGGSGVPVYVPMCS